MPTGIPKVKRSQKDLDRALEIACKRMSPKALEILEKGISDPSIEFRWKLAAVKEILDRAWGRPKQTADVKVELGGVDSLVAALNEARERMKT